MKTSLFTLTLALGALASSGAAAYPGAGRPVLYDRVPVDAVEPQIERILIPGECRIIIVTEQTYLTPMAGGSNGPGAGSGTGGAIVGGVIGGLLGSQVGGGSGKTAATAVGAIAGAIVGGNSAREGQGQGPTEVTSRRKVCEPDAWQERTTGYLVSYRYLGQPARVLMARDPGATLELRVTAEPVR